LRLLRQLRDDNVPVVINSPDGVALSTSLWAVDTAQSRLSFNADTQLPQLDAMVEGDEAVAVAYLESVKLQFDLQGLVLVRGPRAARCRRAAARDLPLPAPQRLPRAHARPAGPGGTVAPPVDARHAARAACAGREHRRLCAVAAR
jgi:hypothetical protein